jgi:hypothetical protein
MKKTKFKLEILHIDKDHNIKCYGMCYSANQALRIIEGWVKKGLKIGDFAIKDI